MPELPDIAIYVERLAAFTVGKTLGRIRLRSPFILRTVEPPIDEIEGRRKKRIAVFNVKGTYYATDDACPHRGAPLGDGPLTGQVVTCTWHGWEFDVSTGCHITDPGLRLNRYKVQIIGNTIFVSLNPIRD